MKDSRSLFNSKTIASLIALSCCLQLQLAALADEIAQLQEAVPTVDEVGPAPRSAPSYTNLGAPPAADAAVTSAQTVLQGGVSTLEEQNFQHALKRLISGATMTSEDYRNLEIGTCGYVWTQHQGEEHGTVTVIHHGSPAEEAGLQLGDVILSDDSYPDYKWEVPNVNTVKWHFDHPGTLARVTVMRGDEVMKITMKRINIEDLPEPEVRRSYEKEAKKLGPSGQGTIVETEPLLMRLARHLI